MADVHGVEYLVISQDGDAPDWYQDEATAHAQARLEGSKVFEIRMIADYDPGDD